MSDYVYEYCCYLVGVAAIVLVVAWTWGNWLVGGVPDTSVEVLDCIVFHCFMAIIFGIGIVSIVEGYNS